MDLHDVSARSSHPTSDFDDPSMHMKAVLAATDAHAAGRYVLQNGLRPNENTLQVA
jgi:hypothetical protein